jgi:hypothetical protein
MRMRIDRRRKRCFARYHLANCRWLYNVARRPRGGMIAEAMIVGTMIAGAMIAGAGYEEKVWLTSKPNLA